MDRPLTRGDLVEIRGFQMNPRLGARIAVDLCLLREAPQTVQEETAALLSRKRETVGDVILASLARGPPDDETVIGFDDQVKKRSLKCWIQDPQQVQVQVQQMKETAPVKATGEAHKTEE